MKLDDNYFWSKVVSNQAQLIRLIRTYADLNAVEARIAFFLLILTPGDYHTLDQTACGPSSISLSLQELAFWAGVKKSQARTTLEKLKTAGLITTKRLPKNQGQLIVWIGFAGAFLEAPPLNQTETEGNDNA